MSKKVEMFQCETCGHTYSSEFFAKECEFDHHREEFANYMFDNGYCLHMIDHMTGIFKGSLPKELDDVKKDTKFKISYLECEDGYVYTIKTILGCGAIVRNTISHYVSDVTFGSLVRGKENKEEE